MDLNLPAGTLLPARAFREERGNILMVTGPRGAGKTTWCNAVVNELRGLDWHVSGLLSPARFIAGKKNGIYAVDLSSGKVRLAASQVANEIGGLRFGAWNFDTEVFAWGNALLNRQAETGLLVIDELGFLEFDLHTGWTAGLDALARKRYRLALVVIRPECIEPFQKMGFAFETQEVLSPPRS